MVDLLLVPIAVAYLVVVGVLFIYGLNFFHLTFLAFKAKVEPCPQMPEPLPKVTVQLPVFNERYVARRLIRAAARLKYPGEKLEIQVLDDSTDETVNIVQAEVEHHRAQGVNIVHVHRKNREGYKAGALGEALRSAKGDFIAIFDADFLPPEDYLTQTIPYFFTQGRGNETPIAFVQTRWAHVNQDYSLLTSLQALAIDAHFMVEQMARAQAGYWFNFNGTAGIWSRQAIEAIGGWKADTLTEDLDLSYRACLHGWRGLYLPHVSVPAELPVTFSAYRRQQHRWAKGSLECAQRLLPQIWAQSIPLKMKIQATLHLTGYGVHLLMFSLSLLYPLILWLSTRFPDLLSLFGIATIFNVTAFAPTVFFVAAQKQLQRMWWRRLPHILFVSALGAGMMVNTLRAAWQVVVGKKGVFERTPKFGIREKGDKWVHSAYQLALDPIVFFELLFAGVNAGTLALALSMKNYVIGFYSGVFLAGLLFTSGTTIVQSVMLARRKSRQQLEEIKADV